MYYRFNVLCLVTDQPIKKSCFVLVNVSSSGFVKIEHLLLMFWFSIFGYLSDVDRVLITTLQTFILLKNFRVVKSTTIIVSCRDDCLKENTHISSPFAHLTFDLGIVSDEIRPSIHLFIVCFGILEQVKYFGHLCFLLKKKNIFVFEHLP